MEALENASGGWNSGGLVLPDGVVVPVRFIRPEDAPALQRLHGRLGSRSIRLRYFGAGKKLSHRRAEYFAGADGVERCSLVALDPEKRGEIIGIVHLDRGGSTDKAEYSALVEGRWQGRGLGLGLTRRLIDEARDKGIRYLYGLVMPENRGMLRLLRSLGLPRYESRSGRARYVEVRLEA